MAAVYSTSRWKATRARAIARDAGRCTVSRLLGGACSAPEVPLHVHHIVPVAEGGSPFALDNVGTACERHHPQWESLRRLIVRRRDQNIGRPRCHHEHRTLDARMICEARLARASNRVAV